jgi:hypothetical protein
MHEQMDLLQSFQPVGFHYRPKLIPLFLGASCDEQPLLPPD